MTKCLVLGGNGFMGSHLVERLIKEGYEVVVFDRFKSGISNLDSVADEIDFIRGDFLDENDVDKALKDVDIVFHYITTTNPVSATKDPIYDIKSNVIGSVRLFQKAVNNKVKKIIYASSGGTIYGDRNNIPFKEDQLLNPINPYSISKATIENYLHYFHNMYGIEYNILRYSNPYGERQNPAKKQGVIPVFLKSIKNGDQPIIYGDGTMVRDYIYIEDAIDATIKILETQTNENVFNIGSGIGTSLNDLIQTISFVTGCKIAPKYVENNNNYISKVVLDISKIKKSVGWKPTTDLIEGVKKTRYWVNNNL